ncbi:MAG: response regulator [Haliscomenobacter sp.]|nr:response regulator [Haliscomenobacter sp.]MBK7477112.1 response regulator [Haliscomenobacter sp.]MBK8878603.1 response regulator [Haliscomenobacter sp.]
MEKIFLLCIEDQREVLNAVVEDLAIFEEAFPIEECESVAEAITVIEDIYDAGLHLAVVISDHVMPDKNGIDFLVELHQDERFRATKKMLLTGLATHADTINAINNAAIDRYIAKPWDKEMLQGYVRKLLTEYILESGIDYQPYLKWLDQDTLYQKLRKY